MRHWQACVSDGLGMLSLASLHQLPPMPCVRAGVTANVISQALGVSLPNPPTRLPQGAEIRSLGCVGGTVLMGRRRTASCYCHTKVECLIVTKSDMLKLCRDDVHGEQARKLCKIVIHQEASRDARAYACMCAGMVHGHGRAHARCTCACGWARHPL